MGSPPQGNIKIIYHIPAILSQLAYIHLTKIYTGITSVRNTCQYLGGPHPPIVAQYQFTFSQYAVGLSITLQYVMDASQDNQSIAYNTHTHTHNF